MGRQVFSDVTFKCAECGKIVEVYKYDMKRYAYKVQDKKFCCYNCYNAYLEKLEGKRKEYNAMDLQKLNIQKL